MAFNFEGEQRIEAPLQTVWEALNDPAVLQACIPGCQTLVKSSDTDMAATVVLKIGPIKATFVGEVTLSNITPPTGYTITGEGKGGVAGFAKGGAAVMLVAADDDATLLTYEAKADIGGKIAQLGSRLIYSTSKKLTEEFFAEFGQQVAARGTGAAETVQPDLAGDAASGEPQSRGDEGNFLQRFWRALVRWFSGN